MSFLRHQPSCSPRRCGFLSQKCCVGLWCSAVALLLLASLYLTFRSDQALDSSGWKLSDLLAHLRKRGVQLHVVPAAENPRSFKQAVYLTEDPSASWLSMQAKLRVVERAHQWHGTVWVGKTDHSMEEDEELARWGEYGCRIGDFYFFGDRRVLRRIQEACR